MKRFLCLLLAATMALSLAGTAMAVSKTELTVSLFEGEALLLKDLGKHTQDLAVKINGFRATLSVGSDGLAILTPGILRNVLLADYLTKNVPGMKQKYLSISNNGSLMYGKVDLSVLSSYVFSTSRGNIAVNMDRAVSFKDLEGVSFLVESDNGDFSPVRFKVGSYVNNVTQIEEEEEEEGE